MSHLSSRPPGRQSIIRLVDRTALKLLGPPRRASARRQENQGDQYHASSDYQDSADRVALGTPDSPIGRPRQQCSSCKDSESDRGNQSHCYVTSSLTTPCIVATEARF